MTVYDPTAFVARRIAALERVGSREEEDEIRRAREARVEVLPLVGSPVRSYPPHVRDAALAALSEHDHRPSRGLSELRGALAGVLSKESGVVLDPEREMLVTNGAMQALSIVFATVLDRGDRVIVPAPNFFLEGSIRLAGGEPVYLPCREEDGWAWDLNRIEAEARVGARVIFACNPTNPSGYLPTREDLTALADMAERYNLLVIADESYDRFVYEGASLTSMLTLRDRTHRIVLIRSLSKSFSLASWRVGYAAATPALIDAMTKVLEWQCLHCAYVPQRVALAAVEGPSDWLDDVVTEYQTRRDLVWEAVDQSAWFSAVKPQACPFLYMNVSRLKGESVPAFRQLVNRGVPVVDGHYFRVPDYVRLPFGGSMETIARLCDILCTFTSSGG